MFAKKNVPNPVNLVIIDQNLNFSLFQQNLKVSQMQIARYITFTKYVGEVLRDMHVKFCVPGFLCSAVIDTENFKIYIKMNEF